MQKLGEPRAVVSSAREIPFSGNGSIFAQVGNRPVGRSLLISSRHCCSFSSSSARVGGAGAARQATNVAAMRLSVTENRRIIATPGGGNRSWALSMVQARHASNKPDCGARVRAERYVMVLEATDARMEQSSAWETRARVALTQGVPADGVAPTGSRGAASGASGDRPDRLELTSLCGLSRLAGLTIVP
jgi:hypothetical protein